jgi:hypothetical protein
MIVNHQLDVRSIAFLANHFFKWAWIGIWSLDEFIHIFKLLIL